MGYAFVLGGKSFGPSGLITSADGEALAPEDADAYNKEVERREIASLKTYPEKVFLYVRNVEGSWQIRTWLGTPIDNQARVGPKRDFASFGSFPSVRRAVTCHIFGAAYHGWYYASSGDYCRLRKAKP